MASLARTFIVSLAFIIGTASFALAQGNIEGTVTEASTGEPLPGVNVVISGLDLGAATDADGAYRITNVPAGEHTVEARYVGFETVQEQVTVVDGETTVANFELRESGVELEELVVTGQAGETRRREIGVDMSTFQSADFEELEFENVEDLMRGGDTGITGISTSGQVGASGTIRLRGVTSVTQGNDPIIMIDGVRMSNNRLPTASLEDGRGAEQSLNPLDLINVEDIENIEVVKGAAATTLYGTEASAGVIHIFTKRGTGGRTRGNFSATLGANMWPQLGRGITMHETRLDIDNAERTGLKHNYNLSLRGGVENANYYLSASWSDENGIVRTQNAGSWSVRGNFDIELFENVSLTWNSMYRNQDVRYVGDGNNRHGYILNVLRLDRDYRPDTDSDDWVLTQNLTSDQDNFVTSVGLDIGTGGVDHSVELGLNQVQSTGRGELPFGYFLNPEGTLGVQEVTNQMITVEYSGNWRDDVSESVVSTFSWGGQLFDEYQNSVEAGGEGFAGPGNHTLSSLSTSRANQTELREVNAGFFLQERIGWRDHTFVTAGLRADGSSTFGENYGFQFYPKVSFSNVLSEALNAWPDFWDQMRLRFALGTAGRAPGAFDAVRTWTPVSGLEGQPGVTPSNLGDPDLGPERTREVELGFDSQMLGNRLNVDLTYYYARTSDALFPVQSRPSAGFTGSQLSNVGTIKNEGLEVSTELVPIRSDDLWWSLEANITLTDDEVLDMGGSPSFSTGGINTEVREGYAPPSFFGQKVTNPEEVAEPEFEQDAFLGQTFPWLTASFATNISIGEALSIRAVGELQRGGHVLNATAALNSSREYWPICNQAIEEKGREGMTASMRAKCFGDLWSYDSFVESNDFFKLRSLSVRYALPSSILPTFVENLSFSVRGSNLFTITDYTALDPEVNDPDTYSYLTQVDYYSLPPRRSVSFKMNLGF